MNGKDCSVEEDPESDIDSQISPETSCDEDEIDIILPLDHAEQPSTHQLWNNIQNQQLTHPLEQYQRLEQGGMKRVDFVLTFHGGEKDEERRERFEKNLEEEGLQVEREDDDECTFVKIQVPYSLMCDLAETMEFRKPLKKERRVKKKGLTDRITETEFRGDLRHIFLNSEDEENFFTSAERAQVVWYLLRRTGYGDGKGIISLLSDGVYKHAYPLHDGPYEKSDVDCQPLGMRAKLKQTWGNMSVWRQSQPLDDIREYFGEEVALYFAWLGLYTKALIPAAVVGVICFVFGLIQLATSGKEPLEDVCYRDIGEEYICKRCGNEWCKEQQLRSSCGTQWLLLLFDHPFTVAYCIFMSFWATFFLEFWKRHQSRLCLQWGGESLLSTGGSDRDTWEPRPEYKPLSSNKKGKGCLKSSIWKKTLRFAATISVVFFMVCIVISAVVGVIVYKLAVSTAFYLMEDDYVKQNSKNFASLTAAIINLTIIVLLKSIYARIAMRLTDMENHKTQSDYDTSYTFKVFVFEFFNCYSSLFYIAFFKGRFYTNPSDIENVLSSDVCDSGGCLAELFIQLVVIMVGKQIFNSFMEFGLPRIQNWLTKKNFCDAGKEDECKGVEMGTIKQKSRWEDDYQLQGANTNPLFQDIMEIILQYGFVTLFVVAFPLAPLCALINNVAEIRIDADKFITQYRRPLPRRTNSIGPWFAIQQIITYIAVAVNGLLIAFTSEFIPRLVYQEEISPDHGLGGYINFTLSVFSENNYTCRYKGFREPPGSEHPYALSPIFWHILTVQLAFVIIFEHIVFIISGIMAYSIADVPRSVQEQAHHDREETKDLLRQQRKMI